jgi:hypothetical protein
MSATILIEPSPSLLSASFMLTDREAKSLMSHFV